MVSVPFRTTRVPRCVSRVSRHHQTLAETEALYRRMIEQSTTHAILHLDAAGRVTTWNLGAQVMTGYLAAGILGSGHECLFTAEEVAAGRPAALLRQAQGDGVAMAEGWRVRKDGSGFWAGETLTAIRDDQRRLTGFLKIVKDLTDSKLAQDRITFLSSLYATLYQVNQAILRCRTMAELFQETVRICADFGHFDLAWIGVPDPAADCVRVAAGSGPALAYLDGIQVPMDPATPQGWAPVPRSLREGQAIVVADWATDPTVEGWRSRAAPFAFQTSAVLPIVRGGRPVAVLTLYSKVADFFLPERLDLLGSLAGDLGFALDKLDADQRRAESEKALLTSEARFRASFDRTSSAKSITTMEGRLVQVNEAYARMMGYARGELEGASIFTILHPEDRATSRHFLALLQAGEVTEHQGEKRYLHKDGHVVWGDLSTTMIRDPEGAPLYLVADLVDITARKALEGALQELNQELEHRVDERTRQLAAANQDLEAFAYGVSHDLRAPLRSLAGFSELLVQEGLDLSEATRTGHLHRIHANALRMSRIIEDLLRLVQVGHEDLVRVPLDLGVIAREAIARLQEADPSRSLELAVADPLPVQGDARLLNVLLGNLLENAWKFTARQPLARIAVGQDPRQAGVWFVQDNGVGFPMAQAGEIFAPFHRLHKAADFPGTGIGLALADRVVRRHGGRIWAQSEPEQGATIYFTLGELPI